MLTVFCESRASPPPNYRHCRRKLNFLSLRSIEREKVREIYRLGRKHGMELAAISGVNGVYSDADIARVRKLALAARAKAATPEGPAAAAASKGKRAAQGKKAVRGVAA